jgi:hypothetical protein
MLRFWVLLFWTHWTTPVKKFHNFTLNSSKLTVFFFWLFCWYRKELLSIKRVWEWQSFSIKSWVKDTKDRESDCFKRDKVISSGGIVKSSLSSSYCLFYLNKCRLFAAVKVRVSNSFWDCVRRTCLRLFFRYEDLFNVEWDHHWNKQPAMHIIFHVSRHNIW